MSRPGSLFSHRRSNIRSPNVVNEEEKTLSVPLTVGTGRPGSPGRPIPISVSPSGNNSELTTVTLPTFGEPVSIMTTPRAIRINTNPQFVDNSNNTFVQPESEAAKNVDKELLGYGYVPINKVLLDEKTPNQRIKYIKAYNPYGELVYILLDGEGMCQGNLCTTMNEISSATSIPYTLRMTAAECNNLDICGLVFECEDGICTLHRKRDNPTEFDEQLFAHTRFLGTPGRDYLWGKTIALPYPIVRLSEIRANPDLVLAITDESFKRMRNTFYEFAVKELVDTGNLYGRLDLEAKKFQNNARVFSTTLMNDIIQLEKFADDHRSLRAVNDDHRRNYKLILANLRRRHEFLEEYLRHIDHYSRTQVMLNSMIDDLMKLNIKMEKTISNLGKVLPE